MRKSRLEKVRVAVSGLLIVLAACGSAKRPLKDDELPPTPSQEVVGGAGRLTSTTFTLDVQLGHPIGQQPAISATYKAQGNAVIKP